VGRIGCHVLDRSILHHLSSSFYVGVVKVYLELLSDLEQEGLSMSQPCALQLLFNLRFLTSILCVPEGREVSVLLLLLLLCLFLIIWSWKIAVKDFMK